eukprot:TRINITY_DN15800_c0_g1_i1.p1 TRINITY_DN15800_c0_g1~~TRINITY_DN15800_c0_g1_i1.p1  ORF type:complete len:183 (-),score=47.33 TRINITY_DN15800_c0_g1_i1:2-550(-)
MRGKRQQYWVASHKSSNSEDGAEVIADTTNDSETNLGHERREKSRNDVVGTTKRKVITKDGYLNRVVEGLDEEEGEKKSEEEERSRQSLTRGEMSGMKGTNRTMKENLRIRNIVAEISSKASYEERSRDSMEKRGGAMSREKDARISEELLGKKKKKKKKKKHNDKNTKKKRKRGRENKEEK